MRINIKALWIINSIQDTRQRPPTQNMVTTGDKREMTMI